MSLSDLNDYLNKNNINTIAGQSDGYENVPVAKLTNYLDTKGVSAGLDTSTYKSPLSKASEINNIYNDMSSRWQRLTLEAEQNERNAKLFTGATAQGTAVSVPKNNFVKSGWNNLVATLYNYAAGSFGYSGKDLATEEQMKKDYPQLDKRAREFATYGNAKPLLSKEQTTYLKEQEKKFRTKADVESLSYGERILSNAIGSLPTSLLSRVPVIGWVMTYKTSLNNQYDQMAQQEKAKGVIYSQPKKDLNASGTALLEVLSEQLFPFAKGVGSTAKGIVGSVSKTLIKETAESTAKQLGKRSVLEILKRVGLSMAEEGSEEVVNALGAGLVAKLTTDKDSKYFDINDKESLITFASLVETFLTGAVAGGIGGITTTGKGFIQTNEARKALNKPFSQVTVGDLLNYKNAVYLDMQKENNQKIVQTALERATETVMPSSQIEQAITELTQNAPVQEELKPVPSEVSAELPSATAAKVPPTSLMAEKVKVPSEKVKGVKSVSTPSAQAKIKANKQAKVAEEIKPIEQPITKPTTTVETSEEQLVKLEEKIKTAKVNYEKARLQAKTEAMDIYANDVKRFQKQASEIRQGKPFDVVRVKIDSLRTEKPDLVTKKGDGTIINTYKDGVKEIVMPDGSMYQEVKTVRETATQEQKTTETVKKANKQEKKTEEVNKTNYEKNIDDNIKEMDKEQSDKLHGERSSFIVSDNNSPLLDKYSYYEDLGNRDWLKSHTKSELNVIKSKDENRFDYFDKKTATLGRKGNYLMLSPQFVYDNTINGVNSERTRKQTEHDIENLNALTESMKKEGFTGEYSITVFVESRGRAFVAEGNHRLQAAIDAGLKTIPVTIYYYQSAPLTNTIWKPDNIVEVAEKYVVKEKVEKPKSKIVEASQSHAGEELGIISQKIREFQKILPQEKLSKNEDYRKDEPQGVRERINNAKKLVPEKTLKEKLDNFMSKTLKENVMMGAVKIEQKYADIRNAIRELRGVNRVANVESKKIIQEVYNKVGSEKKELIDDALLYMDLAEDIANGKYEYNDSALTFGITKEQALKTAHNIAIELAKPENSMVVDALQLREDLMNEVRDELISEGDKVGLDMRIVYAKSYYLHHAIIEYNNELTGEEQVGKGKKSTQYKERKGSVKEYLTDAAMSDFIVMRDMYKNIYKIKLYGTLLKQDIRNSIKYDSAGDPIIPDGYSQLSPMDIGIVAHEQESLDKQLGIAYKMLKKLKVDPSSKDGKRILNKYRNKATKVVLVIPTQIANAVKGEFIHKESGGSRVTKQMVNVWKYRQIRFPDKTFRYNFKNFMGDLDAVIIVQPKVLLSVPQAFKELYDFYAKKGVLTEELQRYIRRTGLSTGQVAQTMKSLKNDDMLTFYEDIKTRKDITISSVKKAWNFLTLKTATEFREQLLRYAAYLHATKTWANESHPTGLPSFYGASNNIELQNLTNKKDRAFRWSDDLLGAYDDVSPFGQYVSDHLIPFGRFTFTNTTRYFRILRNTFQSDAYVINKTGVTFARRAGIAGHIGLSASLRIGKIALGVALFYGGLNLLNHLIAPDEEDDLPEDVKNKPHIIIPSWLVAGDKGRVYYVGGLGSLSELFSMFGIDYGIRKDVEDIATGRTTLTKKIKEIALAPTFYVFNSSMPIYKIVFEQMTGLQFYPDPSKPTKIKDRTQYFFKQIGFENEYMALSGKPLPHGSYSEQARKNILTNVLRDEAAYWNLIDIKKQFMELKKIGETYSSYTNTNSIDYKRMMSAYYYKQAIKLDDKKAQEKYLTQYALYGGTKTSMKSSLRYMNPLNGLSVKEKSEFMDWLREDEKELYNKAVEYYNSILEVAMQ